MSAVLQRFFQAAGCKTQTELAMFLGIRQSSVSDAKRRQVIPADWFITLLRRKSINPDWVLTGAEPRFLQAVDVAGTWVAPAPEQEKGRGLARFSTLELVEELVKRGTQVLRSSVAGSGAQAWGEEPAAGLTGEEMVADDHFVILEQAFRRLLGVAVAEFQGKCCAHGNGGSVEIHV